MNGQNELIPYVAGSGSVPIGCLFDGRTIWATQDQIAEIFRTTQQNVSSHIANIYKEGELYRSSTHKKILSHVDNGRGMQRSHYNLDVVISVGYRVNSKRATIFRQWATRVLSDRIMSQVGTVDVTDQQRVTIADRVTVENNELIQNARELGIEDDAAFLNAGYQGMYGMRMPEIKLKKRLGRDRLLDRAGITELAANEFRITQASALLKDYLEEDGILVGHGVALEAHWRVGQHVRNAIGEIGGTMPEDLTVEEEHISDVRKRMLMSRIKPELKSSDTDTSSASS